MYILGIESSCDETAAAVVENGTRVLSNVIASQVDEHRLYGGVVPEIASRRHTEAISGVVRQALTDANLSLAQIDGIAVTHAPGLIGALLVGVNFAKGLAFSAKKPLIPTHHLRSHIAANYLAHPDLKPPFLCLVASGGHSHIVKVNDYTSFEVIGRTRDDAAGECFDKVARMMGMSYPGGVALDREAEHGNPDAYTLPRPRVEGAPYDFSFSGLKTAAINLLHNAAQKDEQINKADMCASFRKAVIDMLAGNFLQAADDLQIHTLVLAGGVSANKGLRDYMQAACAKRGCALYFPPLSLCGDNGAMVAAQGYFELCAGNVAGMDLNATASLSIE